MSAGLERTECSVCGEEFERKIPQKQHDFSLEAVTVREADCKTEGEIHIGCSYGCGVYKTEYTPKKDHDYRGEETIVEPTCTEKGERRVKCLNCGEEKKTILSALNHSFGKEGEIVKVATCEEDGEVVFVCSRCEEKKTETIKALGHKFGDFIVDKPSSLENDGEKSRHCLRDGCKERKDIVVLPKGKDVSFSVRVVRSDGADYRFSSELSILLCDGEGKAVSSYRLKDGVSEFTTEFQPYQVVIEGLRNGYVQEEFPCLSRELVDLKLNVRASVIKNEGGTAPPRALTVGDPLYDFEVRDVNSGPESFQPLSELLKGKKGAYLYFFYVGCGACSSQFPVFVKEYEAFGAERDLLVIMINVYGSVSGQTAEDMREYKAKKGYPDSVLMMSGELSSGSNLFDWVARSYDGVPYSYFLDGEGVIAEIVPADSASALKERYEKVLSRLLERDPEGEGQNAVRFAKRNFIFAEKRKPIV